ncbi:MAG: hypothetical protein ACYC0Y_23805 [Pirellulales bacterium]
MWPVETTDVFDEWFTDLDDDAQAEVIATVEVRTNCTRHTWPH